MSIDGRQISGFKVVELKNELEKRGLSKSGKKDELIARLCSYVESNDQNGPIEEDGDKVAEETSAEPSVPEEVTEKQNGEEVGEKLEKEENLPDVKQDKEEEKENNEVTEEVKPKKLEDNDTDMVEPEDDQLKNEIEEEILKEERRLKREDERRMKAKRPQDDDEEDVNQEQINENKQVEEESKKEKRKRIEWPKSPAKHSKSEPEDRKPKSPTKKTEHEEPSPEKPSEKLDKDDVCADDTLVMEIDQSDMVVEEPAKDDAEPLLEAEPPLLTATDGVEALEEKEENGVDDGVEGPELPNDKKEEEIPRKKKKRVQDSSETEVIQIMNLTRPFTVNQLKEMLKRTGSIEDFWIDRIKSKCLVHFSSVDQASETRMALDGVKWPVSNPKTLQVTFSSKENLQRLKESSEETSRSGGDLSGRIGGLREWDKNKVNQEGDRGEKRERDRKERRDRDRDSEKTREKNTPERKQPTKTLEELFRKTTTTPSIYWIPLSEEQIKEKEEQRNRKIMEADLLRETMNKMMQDKDGQRSARPRLASGRRRSSSRSDSN